MFSAFFINRPKFALVISIVMVMVGGIALQALPVAQFPDMVPPQVQVTASYPGANAKVVEQTVAQQIESQVNGVDGMIYMSSSSTNDGSYTLTVTFEVGTDPDINAVLVQNRVAQANSQLPVEVTRQGVRTEKQSTTLLMAVNLISPNGTYDNLFLNNYALINVVDALARLPGVGNASVIGRPDYSMRIWMDPDRMTGFGLSATDLVGAIQAQNVQASAGRIGAPPGPVTQQTQYTLDARGRLEQASEFDDIIVRANPDGTTIHVSDIARTELGAESYGFNALVGGKSTAMLMVYQAPGANALEVADRVRAEMDRMSERFPADVAYEVYYDTTDFVRASIQEVVTTLIIAIALVILVVFVFLQDWRSTLIPSVAIPVSLIGTFAVLLAMGFSLNTISLFGLILAIGIVVDDAIVVVENVQRIMSEEGLDAPAATRKAMGQISGAVIATTLVLLAVFVPTAFIPGITGKLYVQFAVTISVAVSLSSINALTLSPALCALLLKPGSGLAKRGPLHWFNLAFERIRAGYDAIVGLLVRRAVIALVLLAAVFGGTYHLFVTLPTSFIPFEDQGFFMVEVQLPPGASLARTDSVVAEVQERIQTMDGVEVTLTGAGYSLIGGAMASNSGFVIVVLKPWEQRTDPAQHVDNLVSRVRRELSTLQQAVVMAYNVPPIPGLGTTGGLEMELQDLGGQTPQDLAAALGSLIYNANGTGEIGAAFSTFRADSPQLFVDIDRRKAETLGIPIADIFTTLQANLGSLYVNDFNVFGRNYKVIVQAESDFRDRIEDVRRLYVRSAGGEMVPLSTLVTLDTTLGAEVLRRYNMFRSASVSASPAPGFATGQAIGAIEGVATTAIPRGFGIQWTGTTFQELQAAGTTAIIFVMAILFAYLFLVAQYESWSMPMAIILAVPVSLLGALLAVVATGTSVSIYTQIGLVMLIGLASKNAILIVEFAMQRRAEGATIAEAACEAASVRFRAVMMTALSFVLGILPLVVATGAGAVSRRALGSAILGGMLAAIVVGIVLVPAMYFLLQHLRERIKGTGAAGRGAEGETAKAAPKPGITAEPSPAGDD
ncbi:MAG: multidrug efflux RND transporter permease subunit [Inquilinus sp.]|nr:multidrug efflux RND transporter permease subunit [Inquilinus sp.]